MIPDFFLTTLLGMLQKTLSRPLESGDEEGNPFLAEVPILYLMKASNVFKGYRRGTLA